MSPVWISLFVGAGVAGWTWSKLSRRTGNADPTQVTIAAIATGLAAFVAFFVLLKYALNF